MDEKYNYRLKIAYDGTRYHGWQVQPNGVSIQSTLQQAIHTITQQDVVVIGSGRTDAGVHALGQVAHFRTDFQLDSYRFCHSMNGLLPDDIRLLAMDSVPMIFHAQYSAKGKIYHYHLWLDNVQSPFRKLYSLHVRHRTDVSLLREAAQLFVGTHDFTAFANSAYEGSAAIDPIRTIERIDVVLEEGGVRLEFEGDGFLYKMVRTMVGTLLEVSWGKRKLEEIPEILRSRDRRRAGIAVPPQGLFLVEVKYS